MIRECGFYSRDGKLFTKRLSYSYLLKAKVFNKDGLKGVIVQSFFNDKLRETREFIEDVDFEEMKRYCSNQVF